MNRRDYIVIAVVVAFYAGIIALVTYRNQPQPKDESQAFTDTDQGYPW